jgi:4-amino-4-deoxy-L-arabinose transferase-like glycosyltransferase
MQTDLPFIPVKCVPEVRRSTKPILFFLFLIALFLRTYELGSIGFSEDEANKILAAESYRHGNFLVNAEHPMFMKILSAACLIVSEHVDRWFPGVAISPEAAVRFPVALSGSLGVFAIFLLGAELFTPLVGLIAAALWAVDINVIALTRIAKEDALATLFFVLGSYFLLRGKRFHRSNPARATRNFVGCGACFGLLMASKYLIAFPWIPLIYYDLFRFKPEPRWRLDRPALMKLYAAFFVGLILFNPILLSVSDWQYVWTHFLHGRITHNGYYMMGTLYLNKGIYTLWGQPVYFFPLYLFVKTPVLLMIALCAGLLYTIKRFRDDHFLFLALYFLIWIVLLSLPGGKFTRYAITFLPAVILLQALGIYLLFNVIRNFLEKRWINPSVSNRIAAILLCGMILLTAGWYLVLDYRYHPHYSFYVSAQAGGEKKWGYYFPQDDFYDAGLREAIYYLSVSAPRGSTVLGTTPAAIQYYQTVFHRPDLQFQITTRQPLRLDPNAQYFIVFQDYRRYLENNYLLIFTRTMLKPLFASNVKGLPSVEIYCLSPDHFFSRAPYWKAKRWPGILEPLSKS